MRLLAGVRRDGATGLADHHAIHGRLRSAGGDLIDAVADAGLRGRGGAGFPAAVKLRAVGEGRRPVVIVNGTEGEPLSAKDRLLLTRAPHLVIDGAELAAGAVGAREILLAAPRSAHGPLAAARAERGSPVTLAESAPGYVAGEETAVIAHLEGSPARPRLTPPRPAQRGYRKRPTLVQNVETLAHLALIARHGAAWFRDEGTPERPGTTLLTLSGALAAKGVVEVATGVALGELLDPSEPLRAVLVGGYFGAWVPADDHLRLDDATLTAHGAALGAGVIHALGRSRCPIEATARITAYMASQSAGQCGPCVHGLGALGGVLERLAAGRGGREDAHRLVRWTEMVRGRGACAHPDGVARMLASATRLFAEELADHVRHRACRACARTALRVAA
jgi:NADH:ubiquinone oxidoreductase subunit F (NADH-binding)